MESEARKRASKKYHESLENIMVRVPKGKKALIQAHAEAKGLSLNAYICALIDADMGK